MGKISHFFIARDMDLKDVDFDQHPYKWSQRRPMVGAGVGTIDVIELESLVTGAPIKKLERKDGSPKGGYVFEGDEDGPWCFALSDKFVQRLSSLTTKEAKEIDAEWLEIDLVPELAALAKVATCSNESDQPKKKDRWRVYLWFCM